MPCYRPLQGWRGQALTRNGKRPIVFNVSQGYADLPVEVPCGQCIGCRLEKARQWAVRLMHEAKSHDFRWFITFTYDDEHLPSDGSLDKTHFQLFMKRLRKANSGLKIRYLYCGEYGDANMRPHYHAIIFGVDFPDRRKYRQSPQGHQTWTSKKLDALWGRGMCVLGAFSYDAAGYVARYVLKKVTGPAAEAAYTWVNPETGEVVKLKPPYVNMSLKPGIAQDFYDTYSEEIQRNDYCVVKGNPCKVPLRYDRLTEKVDPALYRKIKLARRAEASQHRDNQTPERLVVREEVKLAQLRSLKRDI